MDRFETFMAKYGEQSVQAILENWERFQGVRHTEPLELQKRWELFLRATTPSSTRAAA